MPYRYGEPGKIVRVDDIGRFNLNNVSDFFRHPGVVGVNNVPERQERIDTPFLFKYTVKIIDGRRINFDILDVGYPGAPVRICGDDHRLIAVFQQ